MSPIIQINNLSYAYPTLQADDEPIWVLDGVDLSINRGEFVAVMGVTGGGKSTLSLALNGIIPHSMGGTIGGEVLINGENTKQQSVPHLAQSVGLVFQQAETQLFNMTVEAEIAFGLETLGLPPADMQQRIAWALDIVGMTQFRHRSPFELSGGQKQRVAIAAILALKPPVLVLDEPTANLDPAGTGEVFAAVDRLRQEEGMTIILVSHESEQIAAFADRVVVLDQGKIAIDETPKAVFAEGDRLQKIGLNLPQISQLAQQINAKHGTNLRWVYLEDAVEPLQDRFSAGTTSTKAASETTRLDPSHKKPLFELDHVSFDYGNRLTALDQLSVQIKSGDFLAILGQNGSGKTTLVKQLNGLLRPTTGRVLFKQQDIATQTVAELARSISFVFQNPDHMIFTPTVREELAAGPQNLGLSEAETAERVEQMLTLFDLHPFADVQPALLSFGLRRKVSVAAVVAMQTDVLILDEPTSGLDQRSTDEMMALLKQLNQQGVTILMITHDMTLVADHIPSVLLMNAGKPIFQGGATELFAQPDLLKEMGLERPQITQLGDQLGSDQTILTVAELLERV